MLTSLMLTPPIRPSVGPSIHPSWNKSDDRLNGGLIVLIVQCLPFTLLDFRISHLVSEDYREALRLGRAASGVREPVPGILLIALI